MEGTRDRKSVLVVEDNAVNAMVNRRMLEKLGLSVEIAENGRQALQWLARQRFRIVLMDISMPEMDGVEATRIIRSGSEPNIDPNVPIIATTAHTLQGDEQEFMEAGMTAFLAKPISLEKLEEAIRPYLMD